MTVNISFKIQKSSYLYLGKDSPVIRLIKLRKGEGVSGTCYHEVPGCKEKYGLRHSGHKTITITLNEVTKPMEGFYRLYLYCVGFYHHCTTDQLLKSFMVIIADKPKPTKVTTTETDSGPTEQVSLDKPEPTKVTTVETDSSPTEQVSSGKPNATQASAITGSGSKEPVSEGNTDYEVIIGAVFVTIIVAILIIFSVVVYVQPHLRVRVLRLCQNACTRRQTDSS